MDRRKSLDNWVSWVVGLAAFYMLAAGVQVLCSLHVADALAAGSELSDKAKILLRFNIGINTLAARMVLLTYIVNGIVFLIFLHRTAVEAAGFKMPYTYNTPGMTVGCWFIPFVNLYAPAECMRQLLRAGTLSGGGSEEETKWGDVLTWTWWTVFLLNGIGGTVLALSTKLPPAPDRKDLAEAFFGLAVAGVLEVAVAAAFIAVVLRLRRFHTLALNQPLEATEAAPASA